MTPESIRRLQIFRIVTFWVAMVSVVARVVLQNPRQAPLQYVAIACGVGWVVSYAVEWAARRRAA